jgi:nucleotide-binding universal stress UspA family protein
MSYKTIVVHLNNERRAGPLLEFGAAMARQFESQLIGLHVFPSFRLTPPVPLPFGSEVAGSIQREIEAEIGRIKAIFNEVTSNQPFAATWHSITTEGLDIAASLIKHVMAADLVIASQSDPDWNFSSIFDCADRLAIESGRPVIVVPNAGRFPTIPKTIAVAWKGRREAARAVFDAMPLLQLAEAVHVIKIDEGGKEQEVGLPGAGIAETLIRHGVKVTVSTYSLGEVAAAEEIRVQAADQGAQLLVMGAYGHSRLREFAFGGVTRALLAKMTIPVLFSH